MSSSNKKNSTLEVGETRRKPICPECGLNVVKNKTTGTLECQSCDWPHTEKSGRGYHRGLR